MGSKQLKKFVFVEEDKVTGSSIAHCKSENGVLASEKHIDYIFFNDVKDAIYDLYKTQRYSKNKLIRVAHSSGLIGESVPPCFKDKPGFENRFRLLTDLYFNITKFCNHDSKNYETPFLCMLRKENQAAGCVTNKEVLLYSLLSILIFLTSMTILYNFRNKFPSRNEMKTFFSQCFLTLLTKAKNIPIKNHSMRKSVNKKTTVTPGIEKHVNINNPMKAQNKLEDFGYLMPIMISHSTSTKNSLQLVSNSSSFSDDSVFYSSIKSINTVGVEHVYENSSDMNSNSMEYLEEFTAVNLKSSRNKRYDTLNRY